MCQKKYTLYKSKKKWEEEEEEAQSGLQNNENKLWSHSPWKTLPQRNNIGSIKQSLGRAASQQNIINSHNRTLSTEETVCIVKTLSITEPM